MQMITVAILFIRHAAVFQCFKALMVAIYRTVYKSGFMKGLGLLKVEEKRFNTLITLLSITLWFQLHRKIRP